MKSHDRHGRQFLHFRAIALAAALLLFVGCSTSQDPGSAPAPVADPYTECLAASRSWKSILATYHVEQGGTSNEMTFAVEQGGRIAIRGLPGMEDVAIVIRGSEMYLVLNDAKMKRVSCRLDFMSMLEVAEAIELESNGSSRKPVTSPARLGWTLFWDFPVDHIGSAEFHCFTMFTLGERPLFGWLDRLRGGSGVTITATPDKFSMAGPEGHYDVDRRTGLLTACGRVTSVGSPVSLALNRLQVDEPLGPEVFDVSGEPAPPEFARRYFAEYFIRDLLSYSLQGEMDPAVRSQKCLRVVAPLYKALWIADERERVAGVGRRHIEEVADGLRKANPDVPEADIWTAASQTALQVVGDELREEVHEDFRMFLRVSLLRDHDEIDRFWTAFETEAMKALCVPITVEAKKRK